MKEDESIAVILQVPAAGADVIKEDKYIAVILQVPVAGADVIKKMNLSMSS